MSETTASGAGGSAAPGWYADPHDSRQLRWWSGEAWTEHVSPITPAPQTTQAATESTVEQVQASIPVVASAPVSETPSTDALPSRRALRKASAEAGVNAAAEQTTQPAAAQPANPVHDEGAQPALIEPSVDQNSGTGPGQIPKFAQPVLPLQSDLPVQLDQPVQPDQPVPSAQPAEVAEPESGLDALFGTQDTDTDTTDINTTDTTTNTNTTTNNSSNNAALAEPGAADQLPPAGATVPSPVAQWGLTPSGRRAEGERRADARPQVEDSSTPWFWLVVVSPLIAAVLIGLVSAPSGGKPTGWMVALALVVPYLLVLLFAVADKSRLVALGFEEPVPWAWAAATAPVYLIMRAGAVRRESGSGGPGLIVWLVCFVLAILAILGYGLLTHNPLIPGLPG